jgi:low temperature requirement protein LtrA
MPLHVRMSSRDPDERHRASSPLELFFDLTFVVAVAEAGSGLQRGLTGGRAESVLIGYPLVFFAIWWAWMNFSWFASAYDTDDVGYRISVLIQMVGVLIVAVGIPRALRERDFAIMVIGYIVMRLAMVGLWLRAAVAHKEGRKCALRYAGGVGAVQVFWVLWLVLLPHRAQLWVFLVLAAGELAVPIWAEAAGRTSWNPRHIAERYGLFTIIVLGEAVAAGGMAVQTALDAGARFSALATVVVGGLLTVFSMWWLYFDMPSEEIVVAVRRAFTKRLNGAFAWGYGHFLIFASVAATGAGLAVAVDQVTHRSGLTRLEAAFTLTAPVCTYLTAAWALHAPYKEPSRLRSFGVPIADALILASSATPQPVLGTGIVLAVLLAVTLAHRTLESEKAPGEMAEQNG